VPTPVVIKGSNIIDGLQKTAHVHRFETASGIHNGAVSLVHEFIETDTVTQFFSNEDFGNAMNQNIAFGGTPELITDGGSGGTEWTGTANAGTWNFADSGKTTITSADNNDSATFDDAGTIDMSGYTAITGKVDLDVYNPAGPNNNTITIQFGLAGAALGNSVDLNDYINTGDFTEQSFVIPKGDLGIDSLTVDEMTITVGRVGGTRPTVKFDDIQIEQTGTPEVFSLGVDVGSRLHIDEIVFAFADTLAGTLVVDESTNTAAPKATMPALGYDQILGLSALGIGFTILRRKRGVTLFSASIKALGGLMAIGAKSDTPWSDGINTFVTLRMTFRRPLILSGDNDDIFTITINDPMNGLLVFTATATGGLETS